MAMTVLSPHIRVLRAEAAALGICAADCGDERNAALLASMAEAKSIAAVALIAEEREQEAKVGYIQPFHFVHCPGCETPERKRVNLPADWKHDDPKPEGLTVHTEGDPGRRFAFRGDPPAQDRVYFAD